MIEPAKGLIQMALRAGKFAAGDQLLKAITGGSAKLVLVDGSTGANTLKKINDKSQTAKVPVLMCGPGELSQLSSRPYKALAITDAGFACAIGKKVDTKG